jgi:starch synthase (maltosyl-transferring)
MSTSQAFPVDILYVITDLELGGVPLHLKRIAGAMVERGYKVAVLSLKTVGPVGQALIESGITVMACEGRGGWDLRVVSRLARAIRATRPKLVHSFLFHANVAARWAADQAEFPHQRVICEIQTVEVERRWHLWVDRCTYPNCRFTIGNSPSVVQHLSERAKIPRDRLRLVRGGVDPDPIRQAVPLERTELGLPQGAPMLMWVGRLDPVKGLDHLLVAFRAVADRSPAHLVLAGGGPLRGRLQTQADQLGLGRRVHFLGPRGDVPRLLRSCDLFVFPSRTEGLPNALLEAMAAGCAIIATDVPGNRDLIEHGENGLLVPYGEPQALAAAMTSLLSDPAVARQLGEAAVLTIARHWHIRHTIAAYETLYREVFAEITAPLS